MVPAQHWRIITPQKVAIRDVWPHEQYDFSVWVKENIAIVDEQVGLTIDPESLSTEADSGAFAADLVGTASSDETGEQLRVVIENQLTRTDHDHLGKVLTYAAHHEADVAIWIAAEARPEHVRAVQWLNDKSELTAWLLVVEAVAVSSTDVAPLLRRIVGPSSLTTAVRRVREEGNRDGDARRRFWGMVLEPVANRLRDLRLFERQSPQESVHIWQAVPNNPAHIGWQFWVTTAGSWVCLRVTGATLEEADFYFQQVLEYQTEIEERFGGPLKWISTDGARARQLRWDNPVRGGYRSDPDTWELATTSLVDGMERLVRATHPVVSQLHRMPTADPE
jgi:hypothetical protein